MSSRPPCPVPDCRNYVSPGKLMCLDCWLTVPRAKQNRVYRTWGVYRRVNHANVENLHLARAAYAAARDAAIEAATKGRNA